MATIGTKLRHAWNAFLGEETRRLQPSTQYYGGESYSRPDRVRTHYSNERSIITSIYTRIAVDVAGVSVRHVKTDDAGRYLKDLKSGLNDCLTLKANIDQPARMFRQDIATTLFDKGTVALVPVDTSISPEKSGGFDILTMRVGEIVRWYPKHVRIMLYNEATGLREEITLPKSSVAIIENPLYAVMNEPNSTLQRLIRKLNNLDAVDDASASGKLDLIIQLPYVIKSAARREQAEQRRTDIEFQLKGSKHGIAYTDGTEKITQLNRPVENQLMDQIKYLLTMLYGQLGLTESVMDGTADETAMLNYWSRTIEPIMDAIVEAIRPVFLTKTARTQNQSVMYFKDAFKLVPINDIAEIADKFTRNEILASNEFRGIIGYAPSDDPKADELVNSNMPQPVDSVAAPAPEVMAPAFDEIDAALDDALKEFEVTTEETPDETP